MSGLLFAMTYTECKSANIVVNTDVMQLCLTSRLRNNLIISRFGIAYSKSKSSDGLIYVPSLPRERKSLIFLSDQVSEWPITNYTRPYFAKSKLLFFVIINSISVVCPPEPNTIISFLDFRISLLFLRDYKSQRPFLKTKSPIARA